jgi:hypothetical protein
VAAAFRSLRLDPPALFEEAWQFSPRVAGRVRNAVKPRAPVTGELS